MGSLFAAFSRKEKIFIALCLIWIFCCYGSLCGILLLKWVGIYPVSIALTMTPQATETKYSTPLSTYTPYPTSTKTPIPTDTPLFPDYFFPTKTSTPEPTETHTIVPTPENTLTATPSPSETPTTVPTATEKPTGVPPFSLCTCMGDTLNCPVLKDLGSNAAQQCFDYCVSEGYGDIHGLDDDDDSLACE
jgi:hypothetical protein